MAGFRKAKAEQAAIKAGFYGPAGSGKTLTSLICAEGLAKITGKRIAFIDTEHGTDFYCKTVPERKVHPEGFDFDALYTRSITDVLSAVRSLDFAEHGVIVVDSITHLWEAVQLAYNGKKTRAGTIPIQAWQAIKKPYKELMTLLLNCTAHVFICGRQGNEFDTDEESGEFKKVGVKMKAEGETAYEPHILIRMETLRGKDGSGIVTAFAEKDRTGILSGRVIENPSFDNLMKPLLSLLGETQAQIKDSDETASQDAERITEADMAKESESAELLKRFSSRIVLCETTGALIAIGKEITAELKKKMTTADVSELREKYLEAEKMLGK